MLSVAVLAFAVFFVTQLVKPVLKVSFLPQDKDWTNTALRGLVFVISYILVLLNTMALHRLDWSGAWGLLTTAGVVFSVAIASYHILADASVNGASASASFVGSAGEPLTPLAASTVDPSAHAPARTERGTFAKRQSSAPVAVSAPLQTSAPVVVRGANVDPSSAAPPEQATP